MSAWRKEYEDKLRTPEEAVKIVNNGDCVYIGVANSQAHVLTEALATCENLDEVTIGSALLMRPLSIWQAKPNFKYISYFLGAERLLGNKVDYSSVWLSEMNKWYKNVLHPDISFIEVSPPDEDGYMCYGLTGTTSHCYAVEASKKIILQVNKHVPYIYGENNLIHVSEADLIVEGDMQMPASILENIDPSDTAELERAARTSQFIIDLIDDGSCLQLVGNPTINDVFRALKNKNDLGIHSEAFIEPFMELMKE
ncbi:MAG: hypothetical protein FWE41_03595, partial [Coriobacteriia bacterium]|nr:hypothetical protein [Coriobacteriia bacterium]